MTRQRVTIVLVICALALVIRGALLGAFWDSPLLEVPLVDARDVHVKAVEIAETGAHPPRPYDRPPLLTYVTAATYAAFGPHMRHAIVLHLLLGVITAGLTGALAARLSAGRAGVVAAVAAGVLYSLARLPLFTELQLLNEPLQVALVTGSAALAIGARDDRCGRRFLGAGVLAGLAVLARPTSILPLGVLLVWAAPRSGRRSVALGCLLIVGMVSAVTVRNRVAGGEWIPISYNGGINFFIGNARNHEALQDVRPGLQWERLVRMPRALETTGAFHVDPWRDGARAWDERYVKAAWADIVADVPAALGRFAQKGLQFWSIYEIDRNLSPELFFPERSGWRWVTIPFWILGPLGLAGLILLLVDRHRLGVPLALWVLGVMLASVIFFATSRYRAPAYPALAIAATYLATRLARGPRRRLSAALLVGAVVVMAADLGGARDIARARPEFLQAVILERAGRVDEALGWYEKARARDPRDPDVLHQPTAAYLARGRTDRARELAAAAAAAIPDHPAPRFNWGLAAMGLGRVDEAVDVFGSLVDIDPSDARYPYQLGEARLAAGDPEGALLALRRSAGLAPDVPLPWAAMARAYEALGRPGEAADARAEAARRGAGARGARPHP